jgi:hypothetical protein
MTTTTAEVKRSGSESNANVIRRFTKRVQTAGTIRRARSLRYAERTQSDLKKKVSALKKITKRKEIDKLKKLGKIKDVSFYKKSR